jgi:hypothetical protein
MAEDCVHSDTAKAEQAEQLEAACNSAQPSAPTELQHSLSAPAPAPEQQPQLTGPVCHMAAMRTLVDAMLGGQLKETMLANE